MTYCEFCGDQIGYLPFTCKYCGGTFCKKHRLPENHECTFELKHVPMLPAATKNSKRRYQDVDLEKLSSQEFLDQNPRALRKYLKRQERERKKTLKTYETNQRIYSKQTQFSGTKILFSLIIIFSIVGIIFNLYGLPQYIYLSLHSLFFNFTYHTFITGLFVSDVDFFGFFFLIIMLLFLFFMARSIEARKGSKFLIKIYVISGLFTALFYILLRLAILPFMPIEYPFDMVGLAWGGILGILSYSLFPIMNQQITAMMYFLPIRLKGRTFLYIIILFRLLPGLLLAITNPIYVLFYLPDLGGILGAYIMYRFQLKR
ncbi:MAG: AN1-type zinc finger domain-containing protein [Candidatus Thorarchaeota archaeon]